MKMTKESAIATVHKFYEDKKAAKVRKAEEFCNTVVDPKIEEKAKEGEREVLFIGIDDDYIYEICAIVKKQGFFASIQGTSMIVKWYE